MKNLLLLSPILLLLLLPACQDTSPASTRISVRILDETGALTAARVRFSSGENTYLAPETHTADFPITHANDPVSKEADVMMDDDRRFAYIDGQFAIHLPVDSVRIEVVKGFRYQRYDKQHAVADLRDGLEIALKKAFDLPDADWYSGDVHVHYIDPQTALMEMKAEDLNVCNVLISDFTIDQDRFRGEIEPISEPRHLIFMGQEYREDRLGHINLLNLKEKLIEPAAAPRKYQYPLNLYAGDETHKQGGHVSWAHFAAWPGLEGPLGLVLKKVDAVELLCTIDPFQEPIFASDVVPELPMNSGLRLWYRLLNCGLRIPATAGTDKMNNQVTVGANRVFAKVTGDFTYDHWVQALTDGRTFVSNSPFLLFTVDGAEPGAVLSASGSKTYQLRAEVWSTFPIDRLEIVANGELIGEVSIPPGQTHATLSIPYQPKKSAWIAARAYQLSVREQRNGLGFVQRRDAGGGPTLFNRYFGTLRPEVIFAHSSPVYLEVNGEPIRSPEDADYFVRYLEQGRKWLDESGSFPSDTAKAEVLAAFEAGKRAFMQLAK